MERGHDVDEEHGLLAGQAIDLSFHRAVGIPVPALAHPS